jgi:uncharacterized protein (DUF1697 family)
MPVLLAMLRGINVSGQKKVPMLQLKAMFEDLKFKNVRTYIQSGNVIFESKETNEAALSKKISKKILEEFGFEVSVVVRTADELLSVIKKNPFIKEKNVLLDRLYISFLSEAPVKENLEKIRLPEGTTDRFVIAGKEVYLYCPGGYGETKLSNNFFENKLKVVATTRNWKTTNTLLEMMNAKLQ